MNIKVISKRNYKVGYEVRTEEVSDLGMGEPVILKSAYTPTGDYIGDSKTAYILCKIRGIKPEKMTPTSNVCSIGFSEREDKWYGWSHRAICGFGIGSKTKRGNCGYIPSDVHELAKEYREWTTNVKIINHTTIEICVDMMGGHGETPDRSLKTQRSKEQNCYEVSIGRGEWIAITLADAKQMAIDFAEGVS